MRSPVASRPGVAALGLALLLGACSDGSPDDDATATAPPDAPPTALPSSPPPDASPPPPAFREPEEVEPQEGLEDVRPHPWDEVFVLNEGRGIELRWTSAPCRLLDHIDVQYDDEVLTVTLFLGQVDAGAPCDTSATYRSRRRGVPEPVGSRSIADGAEL